EPGWAQHLEVQRHDGLLAGLSAGRSEGAVHGGNHLIKLSFLLPPSSLKSRIALFEIQLGQLQEAAVHFASHLVPIDLAAREYACERDRETLIHFVLNLGSHVAEAFDHPVSLPAPGMQIAIRRFQNGFERAAARGEFVGRALFKLQRSEEHTSELQSRENLVC